MTTGALELAFALHQAPIQRFALRERPLPENMAVVLQLASAAQPQLSDAAARFSTSEETMLEAVRFYLQQVLFEPGTDAYRVLGLAADADREQIRQHHIWLQRWLHPDRRGEDWEAVFATKVNWAWAQLRNEASREEYDRTRPVDFAQVAEDQAVAIAQPVPAWSVASTQEPAPRSRLRRVGIGLLFAVCLALFYLAATQEDPVDPDRYTQQSPQSDVSAPVASPPAERFGLRAGDGIFAGPEVPAAASVVDSGMSPSPSPADAAEGPALRADESSGKGAGTPDRDFVAGSTGDRTIQVAPTPVTFMNAARTDAVNQDSRSLRRDRSAAATGRTRFGPEETVKPANSDSAARIAGEQHATTQGVADASGTGLPGQAAAHTEADAGQVALAQNVAGSGGLRSAEKLEPVEAASGASTTSSLETLSRFELAREHVRNIVRYIGSTASTIRAWNDDQGRLSIERERDALHARHTPAAIDRFALDSPHWSVSDTSVVMTAVYRVDARRAAAESGQFDLDMAWRDGSWKITRIRISPSS